jgi:hypothetical protein
MDASFFIGILHGGVQVSVARLGCVLPATVRPFEPGKRFFDGADESFGLFFSSVGHARQ